MKIRSVCRKIKSSTFAIKSKIMTDETKLLHYTNILDRPMRMSKFDR